jgi:hypothetical protein
LWVAAKALHISPFDSQLSYLTEPQIAWVLSNYAKDEEEQFEKLKLLCRFINPEAARKVFDIDESESVTDIDEFMSEIKQHASDEINEELVKEQLLQKTEEFETEPDLDIIEPIE